MLAIVIAVVIVAAAYYFYLQQQKAATAAPAAPTAEYKQSSTMIESLNATTPYYALSKSQQRVGSLAAQTPAYGLRQQQMREINDLVASTPAYFNNNVDDAPSATTPSYAPRTAIASTVAEATTPYYRQQGPPTASAVTPSYGASQAAAREATTPPYAAHANTDSRTDTEITTTQDRIAQQQKMVRAGMNTPVPLSLDGDNDKKERSHGSHGHGREHHKRHRSRNHVEAPPSAEDEGQPPKLNAAGPRSPAVQA